MNMVKVEFQVPSTALASLHFEPDVFSSQVRKAAAVKWYEQGRISQAKAAEIAGISRAEFIAVLAEYGVTPFQYKNAQDLIDEVSCDFQIGG